MQIVVKRNGWYGHAVAHTRGEFDAAVKAYLRSGGCAQHGRARPASGVRLARAAAADDDDVVCLGSKF